MQKFSNITGIIGIIPILFFRITGFEELGNTDSFQTNVLEKRFGETGTFPLFIMLTHLYTLRGIISSNFYKQMYPIARTMPK
jgi:hypothetical protein